MDCFKKVDLNVVKQEITVLACCDVREIVLCPEIDLAFPLCTFHSHDMSVPDSKIIQLSEMDPAHP